ncbi:TPA: cell division protein FtsL [Mannheimia haemolytica]|uniref:Cell division protein FtsL n=1 Tax=Mannheimia haemolytica TaxID=75985 RepID=A0A248ZYG6_MANHA|nr:cell division protein FtsL [Mannheimia haemolytica]AWW70702.1 cell division protein FtsL [Pasteurellaceae bacterium 12565]AGI31780.1 cell division protein FtsL [Mannheimia haemolytica USDA-ARS-USMARC-183]AGI36115.1 cell division protein FtsL [Mannheimia haemolytica USDA-ARS-USMARC-185]AGK00583.1 cell division protein FtsL [Mannheimia haemolytica M42548]AGQ25449.1 cell division protein FtsL [Mannheimia haemolytica D153]
MSNERYPLHQIIIDDIFSHNKVALLLLIGVVISAVATIWITHQTRLSVSEQGQLIQANQKLESQYTNLQLEENSRSSRARVDAAAKSFGLQPIKKEQEIILVE